MWREEMLRAVAAEFGINGAAYDDRTLSTILMPVWAPENYFCDGEVSPRQARTQWLRSMREQGVSDRDVRLIARAA